MSSLLLTYRFKWWNSLRNKEQTNFFGCRTASIKVIRSLDLGNKKIAPLLAGQNLHRQIQSLSNSPSDHTMIDHNINLRTAKPEQLAELKELSDDDLLRFSGTADAFAVVESNRRLRVALHKEETVIKRLTWALVALTAVLVLVGLVEALRHWWGCLA